MTLLAAGDRVAFPDHYGKAFIGTVLGDDDDAMNPSVLVSWDDEPEIPQSIPQENLLRVTPLPTTPTPVVVPGLTYVPRYSRGWKRYGHLWTLAAGVVAVAIGTWGMIVLNSGMHW